jgi:protein O-mannosyl-transferase
MRMLPPPTSESEPRFSSRVAAPLLTVITLVAVGRLCAHDFLWWDDQGIVHQNPWMNPPTWGTLVHYWTMPIFGLYIPVTYTVWAGVALFAHVEQDRYGIALNPWLFHSTNVFCHLMAVLVAYRILRLVNADRFGAFCGALLFGVHPVQVEAVAWVSGLKDVLSGLFALIAIWQYVAFAVSDLRGRASLVKYSLATTAFLLAMLAKPSAMALPLAALAIDRWVIDRPWRKVLPGIIGWIFIALPIAVIARSVQVAPSTIMPALWLRPLIALDSLAFYAGKLVWPVHLIVDYGRNPTGVLAHGWCYWDWIVPVGIAAVLIAGARKRPVLLAAGLIFVAGCLPVLGFTPALFQFYSTTADHYLYVSMLGPALAVAWLLSVRPRLWLRATTSMLLLACIALTIRQGRYWQNDITLFSHETDVNPRSAIGYINLGTTFDRMRDFSDAIALLKSATLVAPEYSLCWSDLAAAQSDANQLDDAIESERISVDLQSKFPSLRPNWPGDNELLGHMLLLKNRLAEAIPYLRAASDLQPGNADILKELHDAEKRIATQPTTR